jgi:4a-hydroxytetrahydrobiopterin dehydratase
MSDLSQRDCVPCRGGVPPLKGPEIQDLLFKIDGWEAVEEHHLAKTYKFKNFTDALAFVNDVGALAEGQGHHPDIYLSWGRVRLEIWTHKIDGLTESDFILAARSDRLYKPAARS